MRRKKQTASQRRRATKKGVSVGDKCGYCQQVIGHDPFVVLASKDILHAKCLEEIVENGHHPRFNDLEKKEARDMDYSRPPFEGFSQKFQDLLDDAIVRERSKDEPRNYLGASILGEECARKLYFEYNHAPKDEGADFPGRVLRIFERGHVGEEMVAKWMRDAGFQLITETSSGGQFVVKIFRQGDIWVIKGHCDGIVRDGPEVEFGDIKIMYPCVWENKIVNNKTFNEYKKKGLKKCNLKYWTQCNLYTKHLQTKNPALFTAVNADTMEFYAELVPLDENLCDEAERKGLTVVTSQRPEDLPRIASDKTDFRCRFCPYKGECWDKPPSAETLTKTAQAPSWF